ncbi:MAG TPA: hypothetical protein VN457_04825 [Chlamydiales bacterium]|nr:hypothetical protein [Chlamydiales bacterium]
MSAFITAPAQSRRETTALQPPLKTQLTPSTRLLPGIHPLRAARPAPKDLLQDFNVPNFLDIFAKSIAQDPLRSVEEPRMKQLHSYLVCIPTLDAANLRLAAMYIRFQKNALVLQKLGQIFLWGSKPRPDSTQPELPLKRNLINAEKLFWQALNNAPNNGDILIDLAQTLFLKDDFRGVIAIFQLLLHDIQQKQNKPHLYLPAKLLAECYFQIDQLYSAKQYCEYAKHYAQLSNMNDPNLEGLLQEIERLQAGPAHAVSTTV